MKQFRAHSIHPLNSINQFVLATLPVSFIAVILKNIPLISLNFVGVYISPAVSLDKLSQPNDVVYPLIVNLISSQVNVGQLALFESTGVLTEFLKTIKCHQNKMSDEI